MQADCWSWVLVENRTWGKSGFMQEGNKEGGARKWGGAPWVGWGEFGEAHVTLFYSLDAHTYLAFRTMWFFNDVDCFQGCFVRYFQFHVSHRSKSTTLDINDPSFLLGRVTYLSRQLGEAIGAASPTPVIKRCEGPLLGTVRRWIVSFSNVNVLSPSTSESDLIWK